MKLTFIVGLPIKYWPYWFMSHYVGFENWHIMLYLQVGAFMRQNKLESQFTGAQKRYWFCFFRDFGMFDFLQQYAQYGNEINFY